MARGTFHIKEDKEDFLVVGLGNVVQKAEDFIWIFFLPFVRCEVD